MRHTSTTSVTSAASAAGRVRQLFLAYVPAHTPEAAPLTPATVVTLGDEPLLVGRDPGATGLTVPDREASRAHARVERDPKSGAYVVACLGSSHGLYVDGVACARAELHHGSVLRIGGSLLVFVDAARGRGEALRPESGELLGHSLALQRLRGAIEEVARATTNVLVVGEPGVGKALCAATLHARSGRRGRFVRVDCRALVQGAAECELFGRADSGAPGHFVAADGGTLYLDEIGELSAILQARLLRALDAGEVRPVGGEAARRVDVRVIASSERALHADVQGDGFRADLLARLAGCTLELPPLRERREDILRLADGLLVGHSLWRPIAPTAAEALVLHAWPGNVRELRDTLHAAAARAQRADALRLEHLPESVATRVRARGTIPPPFAQPTPPRTAALPAGPAPPSREELLRVLAQCRGNLSLVADYYGKDRRQLSRWLEKAGIDPDPLRD
jgi:DNA-binding NtrC family response regulator